MELSGYDLGLLAFGSIGLGLYLLIKGGDWTVDAACFVAERFGLSKIFIGATIVAFGTSIPELFTSINANLSGYPGLSLGNVIGSNIANILLVLGVTAIVLELQGKPREMARDLGMMVLATILFTGLMYMGVIALWAGLLLFAILVAFVAYQYFNGDVDVEEDDDDDEDDGLDSMGKAVGYILLGLIALGAGAELLVKGAVVAGGALGVPEAVIGMTVVALGTSLPELSTCVTSALKRETNLILGNIIGSNVFNIMSIIGITAIIKDIDVPDVLVSLDLWFMVAVSLAFAAWMATRARITRAMGVVMLVGYVGFTLTQYQSIIAG